MLISHQFLYLGVCFLAVIQTVVCLNLTNNNSPLIIPPSPHTIDHHHSVQLYPASIEHQEQVEARNNYNHQNHLDYDPNLFELVDEESTSLSNSQVNSINSEELNNNNNYHSIGERTAPDTSATLWSRLSGNVVRVFSSARLSSRLNQG